MHFAYALFPSLLAGLALILLPSTVAAQDQFEVSTEPGGEHCSPVATTGAHGVDGGCHVAAEGELSLWVHPPAAPAETQISACHVQTEGFVGEDGSGFTTSIALTNVDPFPCTRTACDEAAGSESPHTQLRWPTEIRETEPGVEQAHTVWCLRTASSAEGTAGTSCELERVGTYSAITHEAEAGTDNNVHQFCTNPAFISFKGHMESTEETAEVEHIIP